MILVTTADERSWPKGQPVLFLGEWCRLYNRRERWQKMDAIVAKPYEQHFDLSAIFERLLFSLCDRLNDFHQTKFDVRYWRIILGHWLQRYVSVVFNRWQTLQQAFQNYDISTTIAFNSASFSLAMHDSISLIWACNDDFWNHILCVKIIESMGVKNLEMVKCEVELSPVNIQQNPRRHLIKTVISNALNLLSRDEDALIINSYLSKREEFKLQIALGQVPQLWSAPLPIQVLPDLELRQDLKFEVEANDKFEAFAQQALMDVLPTCYLEGYGALTAQAEKLSWPRKPRFIFTSNNFDTDEIFKIWTAKKVSEGVPYYTGQHGNNYGTQKNCASETELLATSDRFITWGWTDGNPKCVPAFIFRTAGRKELKPNNQGGLLLIELTVQHRVAQWDNYADFCVYQEQQFRFVESLPAYVQEEVLVRLHGEHKKHAWSDKQRWEDRSPRTKIDDGSTDIATLISRNRLIVHSYDSTGILETLSSNIPTICFWRGGLNHVRDSARPYYEQLVQAEILFDCPILAAKKIACEWDDVVGWWGSAPVQKARQSFCDRYARTEKQPVAKLKRLLMNG